LPEQKTLTLPQTPCFASVQEQAYRGDAHGATYGKLTHAYCGHPPAANLCGGKPDVRQAFSTVFEGDIRFGGGMMNRVLLIDLFEAWWYVYSWIMMLGRVEQLEQRFEEWRE
jgi:hypothetical protein